MYHIPSASPDTLRELNRRPKAVVFSGFGNMHSPVKDVIYRAQNEILCSLELCEETLLVLLVQYDGICFKLKVDRDTYNLVLAAQPGARTILYGYSCRDFGNVLLCDLVAYLCEIADAEPRDSRAS